MLFSEPLFLFFFFPAVYAAFLICSRYLGTTLGIITAASIIFYGWAEPFFLFVVIASAGLDFVISRVFYLAIAERTKPLTLGFGIVANLSILFTVKYSAFATSSINKLLGLTDFPPFPVIQFALPIGVSFIVFEKITYLVDVYTKKSQPAESFVTYLFYVFFFPKLLAGPIIKYHELAPQILQPYGLSLGIVAAGFERFAIGVVKKVLIADPLGTYADQVFGAQTHTIASIDAWLGLLMFSLQIYFDFSGYSDMAIGLALMFGFGLRENFNFPYCSKSVTEFWRRWHISLTTWVRDYLYIPLGGNRVSNTRTYFNLWACFMASGLWHGANWTFVIWGAYHGAWLVMDRVFLLRLFGLMPSTLCWFLTLVVVIHGWIIFRCTSVTQAVDFLDAMYMRLDYAPSIYASPYIFVIAMIALTGSILPRIIPLESMTLWMNSQWVRLVARLLLVLVFIVAIASSISLPFKPFLYFRF
jgi:alginate O-acetyltransferase complex protein AlgI